MSDFKGLDFFAEVDRMDEARNKLIEVHGEDAFKEAFAEFFAAHPEVEALRWRQYTPYFNDGDPCHFRVDEDWDVKLADSDEWYDEIPWEERKEVEADYEPVWDFVGKMPGDDMFEAVFGDHVKVTATRDGFEVKEFDHD